MDVTREVEVEEEEQHKHKEKEKGEGEVEDEEDEEKGEIERRWVMRDEKEKAALEEVVHNICEEPSST